MIFLERGVERIVGQHRNLNSGRAIEVQVWAGFWAMLRLEGATGRMGVANAGLICAQQAKCVSTGWSRTTKTINPKMAMGADVNATGVSPGALA